MTIAIQNFNFKNLAFTGFNLAEAGSHGYAAYYASGSRRVFCIARSSIAAIKAVEAASASMGEISQTCSAVVDLVEDAHVYATRPRTRLRTLTLITSTLAAGTAIVVIVKKDDFEDQSRAKAISLLTLASSAASLFRAFAAR